LKNEGRGRQYCRSGILEILIEQVLNSRQLRQKDATHDERKDKGDQMGAVDAESSRNGSGPGCPEPLLFRPALEEQTGQKCRNEDKWFCGREKTDRLIREDSKRGRCVIYYHHEQ